MTLDLHQTYLAMGLLVSVGVAVSSLELIRLGKDLKPSGRMPRKRDSARPKGWSRILACILDPPVFTVLMCIRLICALAVIASVLQMVLPPLPLFLIFALNILANHRLERLSGAVETLTLVVLFACTAYCNGLVSETLAIAGLWFVVAHTLIAYVTNGLSKARAPSWQDGSFIMHLFDGSRFRIPAIGALLARHLWVSKAICWATIVGESLFPLVLLVGEELRIAMLVAGVLFHLCIAMLMGLNTFFWTFVATYPCFLVVDVASLWRWQLR